MEVVDNFYGQFQLVKFVDEYPMKDLGEEIEEIWGGSEAKGQELLRVVSTLPAESEQWAIGWGNRNMSKRAFEISLY